jgi:hypothetical protein
MRASQHDNDQAACSKDAASSQHFLGCPILQLVNRWRSQHNRGNQQPDENEVGNESGGHTNTTSNYITQHNHCTDKDIGSSSSDKSKHELDY